MAKKTKTDKPNGVDEIKAKYEDVLVAPASLVRHPKTLIRTGSLKLDLMLRGGFRPGTISELYGPEGSGKTTCALHTSKEILARGGAVLYIDLERTLDGGVDFAEGHLKSWPEIIGLDIHHPNFMISRPTTGEEIYLFIEQMIDTGVFELIVLDSMGAMVPRVDLEGNVGESSFGRLAKLNSEALRRVMARFDKDAIDKTHLMFINQARDKVGTHYGGFDSTGGRALKHFVRTKLRFTRTGKDADAGINIINVRVDKNFFSPPWETTDLYINPHRGIDIGMELLQFGVNSGLIVKEGSWYTVFSPETGEELFKRQGKPAITELILADKDLVNALTDACWKAGITDLVTPTEASK